MERMQTRSGRNLRLLLTLGAAALLVSACGEEDEYKNELRPPTPINVTAAITSDTISVSPTRFGAGPIVLVVTNQSANSQMVTFEVDEFASNPDRNRQAGFRQSTGPINPNDTAQLKVVVNENTTYTVRTDDDEIAPATVNVGAPRPSAQNQVLQP